MEGLDIVAFCAQPAAYRMVAHWAVLNRHRLLLVVAPPAADGERHGAGAAGLAGMLPPDQDVLVTRRLRTAAAPVIAALEPDVIVSAAYPQRIPIEVAGIPRFGAIDIQPTSPSQGRGANPERPVHEGARSVAAAAHRILPGAAGPILALRERQLPQAVAPEDVRAAWSQVVTAALDEGVARAAAGDPGEYLDDWRGAGAAPLTGAEWWPTWDEPTPAIQRRTAAIDLVVPAA